ncbi:MAG: 23S rRNA (adenine(2503)-C(2))-methyltransferase RlmN [Balneolaceae bacterium]
MYILRMQSEPTTAPNDTRIDLKSLTRNELGEVCEELGLPAYRATQLTRWLHQKGARSFDEMSNLSKELREKLETHYSIHHIDVDQRQTSADGTVKYLFRLDSTTDEKIESVLIPDLQPDGHPKRLTVCVSSQVGCVFGCSFCATGKMGLFRNLSPGEIVDQIRIIDRDAQETYGKGVTNVVYMGMGEPLHNYKSVVESAAILSSEAGLDLSPKRITVSTVGLTRQIEQLADEQQPFRLAISLHAAHDAKRTEIMPINESLNLKRLEKAVRYYHRKTEQPVTYEYLLFDQFNDHVKDARQLSSIAHWIPSKVNIIMYNPVAGVTLKRAREDRLDAFMKELISHGVTATVRRSRGDDIDAGCGQLAIRDGAPKGKSMRR